MNIEHWHVAADAKNKYVVQHGVAGSFQLGKSGLNFDWANRWFYWDRERYEAADGAKLYINNTNATGGVKGQKIELISLEDKFDPKLALENGRQLIEDKKVLAMFMARAAHRKRKRCCHCLTNTARC